MFGFCSQLHDSNILLQGQHVRINNTHTFTALGNQTYAI